MKELEIFFKKKEEKKVFFVKIDEIKSSFYQPRKEIKKESLKELAQSIKEYGILEPILVRKKGKFYEIIAGHRRVEAAKIAGLEKVPCLLVEVDDKKALPLALVENLQREDLNPIERALSFKDLIEKYGFSQKEIAKLLGKSKEYVANTLRLLKLDDEIKESLKKGEISEGHARALLMFPQEERKNILKKIKEKKLSVRETELLSKKEPKIKKINFEIKFSKKKGKFYLNLVFSEKESFLKILEKLKKFIPKSVKEHLKSQIQKKESKTSS